MEYKERLERECHGSAKENYGFLVGLLNNHYIRIRKIRINAGIGGKCQELFLPKLAKDYEIILKEAFNIIELMREKAYSKETKNESKDYEDDFKELCLRTTNKVNDALNRMYEKNL